MGKDVALGSGQLKKDVETMRTWLASQPHLPQPISNNVIKWFVVGCKGSLAKAKKKLDTFYSCRTELSYLFTNRDVKDSMFQQTMLSKPFFPVEGMTEDGTRLWVSQSLVEDPRLHSVEAYIGRVLATLDLATERMDPAPLGDYFLFDNTHFPASHAAKMTPSLISKLLFLATEVLPIRIKGLIFINAPPAVDFIVNKLVKPFLKEKIAKRVFVYPEDHTVLAKHFRLSYLPKDYGGDADSLDNINKKWMKILEDEREWLENKGKLKSDESKRPEPLKNSGEVLHGTFRRLEID